MKNYGKTILIVSISVSIFACSKIRDEKKDAPVQSQNYKSEEKNILSSSAAVDKGNDDGRKFLRTADIKMKVEDVTHATYDVEDIINNSGGFVSYTNLKSDIVNSTTVRVCKDSSLKTTFYNVQNLMTIRVPNTKLDTVLKSISQLVKYMDYRIIKADDVSLQILANKLEQKRETENKERLSRAIEMNRRKLSTTINTEDEITESGNKSDHANISNLELMDKVKYSTISLTIYQDQSAKSEMVFINKNIVPYEPTFAEQVESSFYSGWNILKELIVFVTGLWSFLLIGLFIFLFIRTLKRRALI